MLRAFVFAASLISLLLAQPAGAAPGKKSKRETQTKYQLKLDPKKMTVCTITINSDNEKKTFKKNLSPKDFQFVELLDLAPKKQFSEADDRSVQSNQSPRWLKTACESNLKCDVLIISGHFGGTFFGDSGQSLSLEALEEHGCKKDCQGVLNHAQEVFLFGCNTLATKDGDHRTPEEYVEVLVRDGFRRNEAERVTEGRYGQLGGSTQYRMKHAFKNVPHLYGFHSTGPLGPKAEVFLKRYLAKKRDYAAHLEKQAVERLTRGVIQLNRALASEFRTESFKECSGLDPDDPMAHIFENLCTLRDDGVSIEQRLKLVEHLLAGPDYLTYLPTIEQFFFGNPEGQFSPEAQAVFERIKNSEFAKKRVVEQIRRIKTPSLKLSWIDLAKRLSWLNRAETAAEYHAIFRHLLKPKIADHEANTLCSISKDFRDAGGKLTAKDIPGGTLQSTFALQAIGCLGPEDPGIHAEVAKLLTHRDPVIRTSAIGALNNPNVRSLAIQRQVANFIHNPDLRDHALTTLAGMNVQNPEIQRKIASLLSKPNDASTRQAASGALSTIRGLDPSLLSTLLAGLKDADENVRINLAAALEKMDLSALDSQRQVARILKIKGHFGHWEVIRVLAAQGVQDPEILNVVLDFFLEPSQFSTARGAALELLMNSRTRDPRIHEKLFEYRQTAKDPYEVLQAMRFFGFVGIQDPKLQLGVARELAGAKTYELYHWKIKESLSFEPIHDPEVLKTLIQGLSNTATKQAIFELLQGSAPHLDESMVESIRAAGFTWSPLAIPSPSPSLPPEAVPSPTPSP